MARLGPAERRAGAFAAEGLPAPLDALIGNVITRPVQAGDAEFGAAELDDKEHALPVLQAFFADLFRPTR